MTIVSAARGRLVTGFCQSEALAGRRSWFAYLPPGAAAAPARRFPCVWLLHGRYGAESDWVVKGSAHLTGERLILAGEIPEVVLVFPSDGLSGDGTFYRNSESHGRNADYLGELAAHLKQVLPIRPGREHAVIGLSMGGFGAFHLADLYRPHVLAAYSHSGALGTRFDATLTSRLIAGQTGPHPLRLGADCGVDDGLLTHNREWHADLEAAGIDHVYREHPGAHTWDYWSSHVAESLRFVAESFPS